MEVAPALVPFVVLYARNGAHLIRRRFMDDEPAAREMTPADAADLIDELRRQPRSG